MWLLYDIKEHEKWRPSEKESRSRTVIETKMVLKNYCLRCNELKNLRNLRSVLHLVFIPITRMTTPTPTSEKVDGDGGRDR